MTQPYSKIIPVPSRIWRRTLQLALKLAPKQAKWATSNDIHGYRQPLSSRASHKLLESALHTRKVSFVLLTVSLFGISTNVHANDMNITLHGLSYSDNCDEGICPNNIMFEKLASQFGISLASPINSPAHSLGQRGFYLGADSTVTFIDYNSAYWKRGVEAGADSVNGSYIWYRLQQRKGLPFGFEFGTSVGHAIESNLWSLGVQLKWSLWEGFRTGIGQLPDIGITGSVQTMIGSDQINVTVPAIDWVLSKPIYAGHAWVLSPYLGLQTVWIIASSEMIRLCSWTDGNQQDCSIYSDSPDHRFDDVEQMRLRMSIGLQTKYDLLIGTIALLFDLLEPTSSRGDEDTTSMQRQAAINLGFGVQY